MGGDLGQNPTSVRPLYLSDTTLRPAVARGEHIPASGLSWAVLCVSPLSPGTTSEVVTQTREVLTGRLLSGSCHWCASAVRTGEKRVTPGTQTAALWPSSDQAGELGSSPNTALPERLGGFLGVTPGRYAGAEDGVGTVTLAVPGTGGRDVPTRFLIAFVTSAARVGSQARGSDRQDTSWTRRPCVALC